jgi:hypothetical protein
MSNLPKYPRVTSEVISMSNLPKYPSHMFSVGSAYGFYPEPYPGPPTVIRAPKTKFSQFLPKRPSCLGELFSTRKPYQRQPGTRQGLFSGPEGQNSTFYQKVNRVNCTHFYRLKLYRIFTGDHRTPFSGSELNFSTFSQ